MEKGSQMGAGSVDRGSCVPRHRSRTGDLEQRLQNREQQRGCGWHSRQERSVCFEGSGCYSEDDRTPPTYL